VAASAPLALASTPARTGSVATDGNGNSSSTSRSSTTSTATVTDVLKAIDLAAASLGTISSGVATINATPRPDGFLGGRARSVSETSTGGDLSVSGKADFLKAFGLTTRSVRASPRSPPPAPQPLPPSAPDRDGPR